MQLNTLWPEYTKLLASAGVGFGTCRVSRLEKGRDAVVEVVDGLFHVIGALHLPPDAAHLVEGLGFRIYSLWFMVYGLWFRI